MKKTVLLLVLTTLLFAGCVAITEDIVTGAELATLTVDEAHEVALASACADNEAAIYKRGYYNESTRTFWLETNIEKEGCNPMCVVKEKDKTAEINWMCTGLITN